MLVFANMLFGCAMNPSMRVVVEEVVAGVHVWCDLSVHGDCGSFGFGLDCYARPRVDAVEAIGDDDDNKRSTNSTSWCANRRGTSCWSRRKVQKILL